MAKWKDEAMAELLGEVQNTNQAKETKEITELAVIDLIPFENHPFKQYTDEKMADMVDSVRQSGILNPLIVRTADHGKYEIIAGHNRLEAARQAGLTVVPAVIKEVDDETAAIIMVDTNLNQREEIRPSEKALAYKIKLEALKKQGRRTDLTCLNQGNLSPSGQRLTSRDIVAQEAGESKNQISRFIRLTELIPDLMEKVDQKELDFLPAVALSYLSNQEQDFVNQAIEMMELKPSKAQAEELKSRSQEGELSDEAMRTILIGRPWKFSGVKFSAKDFHSVLPPAMQKGLTPAKAKQILTEALQLWLDKQENEYEA